MLAIFLAPLYILINIYIVRWMILWMGACTHFFQTFAFRACFVGVYIFLSTSLLTCFLIRKPPALHRFLKNTANYFQGTFLYILIVIVTTDLCRLILKHTLHPAWMYSRKAFVVTGAVCTLLIIGVSLYGIFNQWNIKTKTYDVKVDKQVKGMDSLKIVLLADIHFGYSIGEKHAELLVKKVLSCSDRPTCIILPDDFAALGALNALEELGLSVPEDISIAGYDGIVLSQALRPRLTTIRQDTDRLGSEAAKRLISLINKEISANEPPLIIKGNLLEGASVRDLNR